MNLEVLDFLLDNEHLIEDKATDSGLESQASIGIAKLLSANKGDLTRLKAKQTYHYEKVLQPLLENVSCEGTIGIIEDEDGNWVDTCNGNGVVDDESLYQSYLDEDFKCQICRYDAGNM